MAVSMVVWEAEAHAPAQVAVDVQVEEQGHLQVQVQGKVQGQDLGLANGYPRLTTPAGTPAEPRGDLRRGEQGRRGRWGMALGMEQRP